MLASVYIVTNRGFIPAADRADSGRRHAAHGSACYEERKRDRAGLSGAGVEPGAFA